TAAPSFPGSPAEVVPFPVYPLASGVIPGSPSGCCSELGGRGVLSSPRLAGTSSAPGFVACSADWEGRKRVRLRKKEESMVTSNTLPKRTVAESGNSVVSGQRQQQASYPPGHGALHVRLCCPLYRLVQNG